MTVLSLILIVLFCRGVLFPFDLNNVRFLPEIYCACSCLSGMGGGGGGGRFGTPLFIACRYVGPQIAWYGFWPISSEIDFGF